MVSSNPSKLRDTVIISTYVIGLCVMCLWTPAKAGLQTKDIDKTTQQFEVGFSPEGSAEALVLKAINSAHNSINVLAYSFTSQPIAEALVMAHKRGIDIQVVVDRSQKTEKYTSATFLANAGIPVRIDYQHAIAHNKVMIIDRRHVETGSFNYTAAAAHKNAENAIVIWNNVPLAEIYLTDWNRHWQHLEDYRARY